MPRNYDIRKFGPEGDESRSEFPPKGIGQILNELGNLIFRSSIRAFSSAAGVQVVEAWVLRKIGYKKVISAREIAAAMSADEGQISRRQGIPSMPRHDREDPCERERTSRRYGLQAHGYRVVPFSCHFK